MGFVPHIVFDNDKIIILKSSKECIELKRMDQKKQVEECNIIISYNTRLIDILFENGKRFLYLNNVPVTWLEFHKQRCKFEWEYARIASKAVFSSMICSLVVYLLTLLLLFTALSFLGFSAINAIPEHLEYLVCCTYISNIIMCTVVIIADRLNK